jgi:hypothetical protein
MDECTDDDLLLGLIEFGTINVLERTGDDPAARYAFFKRFVELAQEATGVPARDQKCHAIRRAAYRSRSRTIT